MLTRYRELYNELTKSKAFGETGPLDNSKVDKSKFTPNNLKSIILGSHGAIAVYYTTNKYTSNLEKTIVFKNIPKNPAELEKYLQLDSDKGMVDALHTGLKFSNLEEIIFFAGGFSHQYELEKELLSLQAFIGNNSLIMQSFKRLRGVYVVDRVLIPEELVSLDSRKPISNQLKNIEFDVKAMSTYYPEVDEYGAVKHAELKSGENGYLYDTPYEPKILVDDKVKGIKEDKDIEETRLARYFYNERKAARLKFEADHKRKLEKEEIENYDGQLVNAVKATIGRLERFYSPLWEGNYFGMLHEGGIKFTENYKNRSSRQIKSNIDAIYNAWATMVLKGGTVESIEKITVNPNPAYSPGFHYNVLKNKKVWETNIKPELSKVLLKKYAELFEETPEKINEVGNNLTNCLVITKWGKNDFLVRFTGVKQYQKQEFMNLFEESLAQTYLAGSQPGIIASCEIDRNGIGTLTYIVNWQDFTNEILFAHKLYSTENVRPSLTNAVIGLKMDGRPYDLNLIETGKMLTTILAGSRSGKGVMTMGLLASLFGAGGSVVYLDNKPDIGAMLWELEREYAHKGLKLLSLDIGKEEEEFTGAKPVRTGSLNLLEDDLNYSSEFRTLRLCKLFQLVTIIGRYNREVSQLLNMKTDNLFFIVDELTSINIDLTSLELYVRDKNKEYASKAMKVKATDEEKYLSKYYGTLDNMITQLNKDLVKGLTKEWGQSGIRVILIGQELGRNWKVAGKAFSKSFAGLLMGATHNTISGRGQATDATFAFNKSQKELAGQRGVFSITTLPPSPVNSANQLDMNQEQAKSFTQFRSYFSLVKNDFNYEEFEAEGLENYVVNYPKRFTSQLLSGYIGKDETEIKKVVSEFYNFEEGKIRDEVSFSGLIKVMQEKVGISEDELMSNMGKGYTILDKLFQNLGLSQYNSLEEYLCDCGPDGVYTINELCRMLGLVEGSEEVQEETYADEDIDFNIIDVEGHVVNDDEYDIDFTTEEKYNNEDGYEEDSYTEEAPTENYNQGYRPSRANNSNIRTENKKNNQPKHDIYSKSGKKVHRDPLKVEENPWKRYKGEGIFDKLNMSDEMTKIIMEDIEKFIGDASFIRKFSIMQEGILVFNDIIYTPTFEEDFLSSLPNILREKIQSGNLVEFFNLRKIKDFKNLEELVIESETIAQGRARIEIGLGYYKRYNILFNRFPMLMYIRTGDIEYYRDNIDVGEEEKESKFVLPKMNFFKKLTGPKRPISAPKIDGWLGKVWESKPVNIIVGSLGWTAGAKVVYGLATFMGPWGLLFGGLAAAGAYSSMKHSNNNNNTNTNYNTNKDFDTETKKDTKKEKKK